jgi:hypothetical protein
MSAASHCSDCRPVVVCVERVCAEGDLMTGSLSGLRLLLARGGGPLSRAISQDHGETSRPDPRRKQLNAQARRVSTDP